MKTKERLEKYRKHLSKCLKDRTCGIVDRGLAQCLISGEYCSYLRCPKLEDNVTPTANIPARTESLIISQKNDTLRKPNAR